MTAPKMLTFFDAEEALVDMAEGGLSADLHFLHATQGPLVVTVHRRTLEQLQDRIAEALASSQPTFDSL